MQVGLLLSLRCYIKQDASKLDQGAIHKASFGQRSIDDFVVRSEWPQPKRITEADRVVAGICVEVDAPRQPNGILGDPQMTLIITAITQMPASMHYLHHPNASAPSVDRFWVSKHPVAIRRSNVFC